MTSKAEKHLIVAVIVAAIVWVLHRDLLFAAVIATSLDIAWRLWEKGDEWSPPWQEKDENETEVN